jgi:hypothetical protein
VVALPVVPGTQVGRVHEVAPGHLSARIRTK